MAIQVAIIQNVPYEILHHNLRPYKLKGPFAGNEVKTKNPTNVKSDELILYYVPATKFRSSTSSNYVYRYCWLHREHVQ